MTSIQRLQTIKTILESELPKELTKNNLSDFSSYKVDQPYVLDQDSCSIITMGWTKSLELEIYKVGITFQLVSGDTNIYLYESIIVPVLFKLLTPEVIEMVNFESIVSETFPPDDKNSVWIKIVITYTSPIDSSEYWGD